MEVQAWWTADISPSSSVVEHLTSNAGVLGLIPSPAIYFHLYFYVHSSHPYYNKFEQDWDLQTEQLIYYEYCFLGIHILLNVLDDFYEIYHFFQDNTALDCDYQWESLELLDYYIISFIRKFGIPVYCFQKILKANKDTYLNKHRNKI